MGRRREPRHPLGRGEREDRDRLKKQLKKAREKRRRRHQSSGSIRKSGDGGFEQLEDICSDENDDASEGDQEGTFVDTQAEAGGTGLLLVPLTPAGKPASTVLTHHTCPRDFFRPMPALQLGVFQVSRASGFSTVACATLNNVGPLPLSRHGFWSNPWGAAVSKCFLSANETSVPLE